MEVCVMDSSTETLSLSLGDVVARRDDREELKGKKRGWAKLPSGILQRILSIVLEDTAHFKAPFLAARIANDAIAQSDLEYIAILAQRTWMCKAKDVCFNWRRSVMIHPWWSSMARAVAGDRIYDHHVLQIALQHRNSSSASSLAPFVQARDILVGNVCVICQMAHPDRLGRCCYSPEFTIRLPRIGYIDICEAHALRTCTNCLQFIDASRTPLSLLPCARGDRNEEGTLLAPLGGVLTCQYCRDLALATALDHVLTTAARGTIWTGKAKDWRATEAWEQYVNMGSSGLDVFATASLIVERAWLRDNTTFRDLEEPMSEAIELELKMMTFWVKQRKYVDWGFADLLQRITGWSTKRCRGELERKFLQWQQEIAEGWSGDQMGWRYNRSVREWYERCRHRALVDWINQRMAFGFWWPVDEEIRQIVELGHTNLPMLRNPIENGFVSISPEDTPEDLLRTIQYREGLILLSEDTMDTSYFPPTSILVIMHRLCQEMLYRIITPAMGVMVKELVEVHGSEAAAEDVAREYGPKDILQGLQRKSSWLAHLPSPDSHSLSAPQTGRKSPLIEVRVEHPPPHQIVRVEEDDTMTDDDSISLTDYDSSDEDDIAHLRHRVLPGLVRAGDAESLMRLARDQPRLRARAEEAVMQIVMERSVGDIQVIDESSDEGSEPKERDAMEVDKDGVGKDERGSTADSSPELPSAIVSEKTRSSSEGTNEVMPITPPETRQALLIEPVRVAGDGEVTGDAHMADTSLTLPLQPHALAPVSKSTSIPTPSSDDTPSSPSSSSAASPLEDCMTDKQYAPSPPDIPSRSRTRSPAPPPPSHATSISHPPPPGSGDTIPAKQFQWIVPESHLPFVPPPSLAGTGVLAEDTIMRAWWDARAYLRECKCTICERSRKRTRDEEAGGWWAQLLNSDDNKKRRVG